MKKISRRDFLKVTGLVGAAAALTACGGSASSTAASTASSAAGSAAASTAALGADTQAIVDRGVLKVGVKNAVQGFSFQDTLTGEYKGLEDSLAEMIAEHLGVDVEFTTVTAATRGELLDSGDIDAVLATFTITEERKKTWDFSTPYYTDYVSVLVEDSTGIKGLADLKDKVVGVSSGSTSARALVKAMIDEGVLDGANFDADTFNADTWKDGVSFRQYDDYPAISTALSAGEVQGFCVDKSILAIYKTEGRSYIDAEFSPQEYGVATKKGSDFSTLCDDLVKGWLADGTIEQLIKDNGLDEAQTFQNQESAGKGEFAMSGLFSLESWSTVWTHRESFLLGLGNTLQTAVCALALAFIIGAALGLMSTSGSKLLRIIARIYVEFVQNTPLLLQLCFLYYALAFAGVSLGVIRTGIIALGVYTGAYMGEVVRAAIESVPKGQFEAAQAQGFNYLQRMGYIILPQSIPVMLPPMVNQVVNLFKNTSCLYIVGGADLISVTYSFVTGASTGGAYAPAYIVCGLIFFVVCFPLSTLAARWEASLKERKGRVNTGLKTAAKKVELKEAA